MGSFVASLHVIRDVLSDWWYGWFNLAIMSTLWVFACLTLVLAPPATFALFSVAHDLALGQRISLGDFFVGLRRYFLKSWQWALLNLAAGLLFWANFQFYGATPTSWAAVLFVVSLALATLWSMIQLYTVAYLMMYEKPRLWTALRSAAFTLFASPLYSLILAAFVALLVILSSDAIVVLFLGAPVLIALTGSRAVRERLQAFQIIGGEQPPTDDPVA